MKLFLHTHCIKNSNLSKYKVPSLGWFYQNEAQTLPEWNTATEITAAEEI